MQLLDEHRGIIGESFPVEFASSLGAVQCRVEIQCELKQLNERLQNLEKLKERSSWLAWSNVEPRFVWLRAEPEFAKLMDAMKFL